jgi:hypothetical protein
MNRVILLIVCLAITCSASAQIDSAYYYYRKAKEEKNKDTTAFYQNIIKAHHFHPYHPGMLYEAAVASAMVNKNSEAIQFLKKALLIKADIDLTKTEFKGLTAFKQFDELKTLQEKALKPVVNSDTAFVIKDRSLHLECIARGIKPGTFFCGSVHKKKIISCDSKGNFSDFTSSGADGLTCVLGIKADSKRNILWACSSPMREMENYDSLAQSAVFKYDVNTKKLLKKYVADGNTEHVFGDITLDRNGDVFVSDSRTNIIYTINSTTDKLEAFFTSDEFWNLQGISFDNEGKNLFIADYIKGIYKLDLSNRKLTKLEAKFDLSLKTVDGLTYYKNSLIGIQNSIYPMRVTQYFLSKDQTAFTGYRIIDSKHPAFNEPTIGFVDEDTFYYVANSLWSGYDEKSNLKEAKELQDVVILKASLNKK